MKAMTRWRARLLALTIVISTVVGASIASGGAGPNDNYEITEGPSTTRARVPMEITRSVLSIRNISTVTRVFGLFNSMIPGPCTQTTMVRIDSNPSITSVTLAPGEQTQFESSSLGSASPVALQCQWSIMEAMAGQQFDTVHQYVMAPTDNWDLQPKSMIFRPTTPTGEIQRVYIQNYTTAAQSYDGVRLSQATGLPGSLTFVSFGMVTCLNMTSCTFSGGSVPGDQLAVVDIKCVLSDANPVMGTLELLVGGVPIQSTPITCATGGAATPGIQINPTTLNLSNPVPSGSAQVTSTSITVANAVMQAQLAGDPDFMFNGGPCTGTAPLCNPMTAATTPVALPIRCTPDGTTRSATLYVTPVNGLATMSIVQCVQDSAGPPMLHVSPLIIPAIPAVNAVGADTSYMVTLTNVGAGTLTVHAEPPAAADWTVQGCPSTSPCQVIGNGSGRAVQVTFNPTAHGDRSSSMLISANNGTMTQTVTLQGTGTGAVLELTEPTAAQSYTLELGTVGLNTPQSRTLKLRNNGNVSTSATVTAAGGAPFMLSTTTVSLPANPGMDSPVTVTCRSATAVEDTRTITITKSANTYRTEPTGLFDQSGVATVSAHCKVVNTSVQIMPELDFGEVWRGAAGAQITAIIRNPLTAVTSARITGIELVGGVQGLTLGPTMPIPTNLPRMLAPGEELMTTLTLSTATEVDLATARLRVTVDSVELEQPISGKVVTPSARLAPATNLELGTACVGSDVSGTVMLINDGTATLTMMRPTMDGAFTPTYVDPTTYAIDGTALLAPMRSAIASVHPSMSAGAGPLEGTLTWNVEGPGPFTINVSLLYINAGAAVSPGALSFGPTSLEQMSKRQTITLENCNSTPIDVSVEGLVSTAGNLAAWDVQPKLDMRTLQPEQKMTISVAFAPTRPGPHAADLRVVVGDTVKMIRLEGEGIGIVIDRSSFYACSCQGGRAPLHGWPLVVAVLLIVLPRRRRTSTDRST